MSEIVIAFIGGITLLLLSTKTLIKLSEKLSLSLKLSPLIIGMTVVAIGTSLPELSVSTIASIKGDVALAIGNIIGSNIINILLVFAVGILIGNLRVGTTKTPRNAILLLLTTIVYTVTQTTNLLPRNTIGFVFILSAVLITFIEYKWALFGRTHEDNKKFQNTRRAGFSAGKTILLILSVAGIITGGYFVVVSTEKLSLITGISTGILGLTLTAVATSLPELLTTIFSQEAHDEKMTIGNVIGSNLYNLLLIGGLIDFFSPGTEIANINWITLNIVTLVFVLTVFVFKGKTVPKWVGLSLLCSFIFYIILETNKI